MSFSYDIKTKLAEYKSQCEFCKLAELYGMLSVASSKKEDTLSVITEHEQVLKRIKMLFKECIGFVPSECDYAGGFKLEASGETNCDLLAEKLHLGEKLGMYADEIMPFECCRVSYIRGAFLGGGSVSDPKKSYHMEFDARTYEDAENLRNEICSQGISAKITERKKHSVVYIKGYEDIASLMGLMGVGTAAMEIYNISIEKELRNEINRRMNCETANIDKVAKAYVRHMQAIEKISRNGGIDSLPQTLAEIAKIRMEYPDESLKELGQRLSPPIGKSGVNHRLNRILEIAEKIK